MPFDQVLVLQIAYIGDLLLAPYRPSVIHVDSTTLACRLPTQNSIQDKSSFTWPLLILIQEYIMYKEIAIAPANNVLV